MVPWGIATTNPSVALLLPFGWLLWQIYLPRLLNGVIGKPPEDGFVYDSWWTSTKQEFKSEFDRVDERADKMGESIEYIANTQDKLVKITIAQSHMLNGYDGDISVEDVKDDLRDESETVRPSDYLDEDPDEETPW